MRLLALVLAAGLAACGGERSTAVQYADDGGFVSSFADPGENTVADAVRALPFRHVEWEYKFNQKPIARMTLAGDQLLIETPDARVIAMDRFNGKTQWIFKVETDTMLDWAPVVAEGVPEEIRQLEADLRLVNRQIDDKLKELGPGKETQALQKKRAEYRERLRVAAFGDNVYFISRQVLYCLDRISGGLRWTHRLLFVPSARPFAIRNYVFVPGADLARVWVLDVEKKGQEITFYKADITTITNQVMNRPVYSPPSLFFVCHDGKVYSYNVDTGNLNWAYPTERELRADPLVFVYRSTEASGPRPGGAPELKKDGAGGEMKPPGMGADMKPAMGGEMKPGMGAMGGGGGAMGAPGPDGAKKGPARAVATTRFLFAGGTDNAFYALDADAGAIVWKYECGTPIKSAATAKDSTVYVRTEEGALHAFEVMPMHRDGKGAAIGVKRNGNLRWKIPLAERFLSKGKDRVYVMGPRSEIWALHEITGEVSGRYPTEHLQHILTNAADEYVYVANSAGYVYCLKESKESY
jgi:outer membrane protein assembly factor BamB